MNTEHVFREDSSMARTAMPEDKKLNSFGAAIKKYRTAAGYSQQELADTMNITRHAVYCWENNSARPDIETIRELTRLRCTSCLISPPTTQMPMKTEFWAISGSSMIPGGRLQCPS